MGQRVAGHPAISPFAMAQEKTITVCKPYLLLTLTTLLPLLMSLLTLGDNTEDSEYKEFDDELDV